jgi:cholesterol transport system auxiliary component
MRRRGFLAGTVAAALGGCALGSRSVPPALYDFGVEPPPVSGARVESRLGLAEVSANPWLQTSALMYRLAYRDTAQLRPYALSRWAAPPAELIEQRLRFALAHAAGNGFSMAADGLAVDHLLRVHLETFEQVVDSPTSARAVARMRARLSGADRRVRAQHLFQHEERCQSVDAAGSVHALAAAADALVGAMVEWIAAETRG